DEPRHMVENICERLKKTFGSKDENALHWIFNVSIFKAIDDFEQWPDIIECPSDKQKEVLSQLELALVVRELFRNCHDNLELNQIIDHHKPEEGLMKLMSLMAQRQNIAERHFVALADKIQMIKEHFKLQEVMESIEVEDMMPGFKEKF